MLDNLAAKGRHLTIVECPSCKNQVVVALGTDRARCAKCGKDWPWSKTRLYRVERQ